MNSFDYAWLAGLTDGEGSLHSRIHRRDSGPIIENVWTIGMTDLPTIKEVQQIVQAITGRKYRIYQGFQRKAHHKPWYRITVSRKAAISKLLTALIPFLRTKRKIAQILLQIANRPWGVPSSEIFALVQELKQCNQKGIPSEARKGTCTDLTPITLSEEKVDLARTS